MIESITTRAAVILSIVLLWSGSVCAADPRCDRALGNHCATHESYSPDDTAPSRLYAIAGWLDSSAGLDKPHSPGLIDESFMALLKLSQPQIAAPPSPDSVGMGASRAMHSEINSLPENANFIQITNAKVHALIKPIYRVPSVAAPSWKNPDMTLAPEVAQPGLLPASIQMHSHARTGANDVTDDGRIKLVADGRESSVAWLLALCLAVVALRRVPFRVASAGERTFG